MREIKFRIFDNKKNKYLKSDNNIIIRPNGEIAGIHGGKGTVIEWELEQYTGLKDKNGKEIYEGDILFGQEEGNGETTAWTDVYLIVFFKEGCFCVRNKDDKETFNFCDILYGNDIIEYYEVIGNIHENKDLLK